MEHKTRYTIEVEDLEDLEDLFEGRLSYRLYADTSVPIPELWDLNAITHSVSTLRQTFKRLEHSGVHIPIGRLRQSWQDLLQQVAQNAADLDSIVCELFEQSRQPQEDTGVLEETLPATDSVH